MRVTKESSDPEALDSEGKCKDIKTVKAKDKITISRLARMEQLKPGCQKASTLKRSSTSNVILTAQHFV